MFNRGIQDHRRREMQVLAAHLAGDLAVIGPACVEEQQRMAGRRGIHHHEPLAGLADDPGKRLKDGNFLGAGRTQIFLEEGTPLGVERCSPAFDDVRYRRRRDWEAQRRADEPTPSDCFTAANLAWPLGGIGQVPPFNDPGKQPSERLLHPRTCRKGNSPNSAKAVGDDLRQLRPLCTDYPLHGETLRAPYLINLPV